MERLPVDMLNEIAMKDPTVYNRMTRINQSMNLSVSRAHQHIRSLYYAKKSASEYIIPYADLWHVDYLVKELVFERYPQIEDGDIINVTHTKLQDTNNGTYIYSHDEDRVMHIAMEYYPSPDGFIPDIFRVSKNRFFPTYWEKYIKDKDEYIFWLDLEYVIHIRYRLKPHLRNGVKWIVKGHEIGSTTAWFQDELYTVFGPMDSVKTWDCMNLHDRNYFSNDEEDDPDPLPNVMYSHSEMW